MVTPTFLNPTTVDKTDAGDRIRVSRDQFLSLLVAELRNQNPMEPLDNSQFLQQLAQLEQLASSSELQSTLAGMSRNQTLVSASNLIGKYVKAIDPDTGESLYGKVDGVTMSGDQIAVKVAGKEVQLGSITEVIDPASAPTGVGEAGEEVADLLAAGE
ncbi:MAG: hypothetical protein HY719_10885 [Planctomycetes bacterium]|nr:hypothetical protein [Planctomycetota bacterium]